MRRIMQRFQPAAIISLLLVFCLSLLAGCSWTSRQLGMSDESSEAYEQNPDTAKTSLPANANAADKRALLRLNFGIEGPIHIASKQRRPIQTQASYTTGTPKSHADRPKAKNKMVVKRTPPKTDTTPAPVTKPEPAQKKADPLKKAEPQTAEPAVSPSKPDTQKSSPATAPSQTAAAPLDKGTAIDPKGPQPPKKLHTSVPMQHAEKTPPHPSKQQKERGDIIYGSTKALREAVDKAVKQKSFLGYTDPFDAFPALKGNDTMSAAFIPVDHPNHKVFYHAFYTPDKPFNRRVYGYTVIDMITKKDYGHFDGNADGKFEQSTLHPSVVFEDYARTSNSQFGEKMPEVKREDGKKK